MRLFKRSPHSRWFTPSHMLSPTPNSSMPSLTHSQGPSLSPLKVDKLFMFPRKADKVVLVGCLPVLLAANGRTACVIVSATFGPAVGVRSSFMQCGSSHKVSCFICAVCDTFFIIVVFCSVAHKTGCSTFNKVFIPFCVIYIIATIISLVPQLQFVYWIPIIFAYIFSIFLRFHVVDRYQITSYGGFGEFLVACCCCSCSICQSKYDSVVHKQML
jgi:Cys-rich protein (TIGR01571 family)